MIAISITLFFAFLVMLGLLLCQSLEIDNLRYEVERKEDELEFVGRVNGCLVNDLNRADELLREKVSE
jgi:hypothetical protein